ncbi:sushi-domain containing secreted protein [Cryptosporidium canis]|uniref:Sushi-domain containing secreted protein n=1 Tax=Cryptosporidium canis TaxID=195482 RepID=A0ABQ8PC01_9CRYT|nr:sushi-domain containing secreted protein [Cryptosporidium canis]KAJ1615081.1 sushi-domain containing secreted protein [Cryptosporidium canis]
MAFKLKYYFILICVLIIVCGLPHRSRCESLESEEIPAAEEEFGEADSGALSQEEFKKAMTTNSNDTKAHEQNDPKPNEGKFGISNYEETNSESVEKNENKSDKSNIENSKDEEAKNEDKAEESKQGESKETKSEIERDDSNPDEPKHEEDKENASQEDSKSSEIKKGEDDHKDATNDPTSQNHTDSSDENNETVNSKKDSTVEGATKNLDAEHVTNHDSSNSDSVQESATELEGNSSNQVSNSEENADKDNSTEKSSQSISEKEKPLAEITDDKADNSKDDSRTETANDNSKEAGISKDKSENDTKLEDDVEKTIQEMKDKLDVNSEDETIKRVDDQFIVIIKKLKQKKDELLTDTKDVEVKSHDTNCNNCTSQPSEGQKEEKSSGIKETESSDKSEDKASMEAGKSEKNETDAVESHEDKTNEELIEKLKSLSADGKKDDSTDQQIKKINNLLEVNESDEKMERLIQEKKEYDEKKKEREKLPLQKKKKWYEKRDPITGELLFDAAALSRNITSTLSAKRRKGAFSKCVEFHGQKENCESTKNCFYDSIYGMCLFDCSLLNKKDACEEFLECRFDFVVPRKACVNDCFQSRNFVKQEMNGIMRGCMWCTQEVMCNTLSSLQKKKYPDTNYREFDCNWQVQNGLENKDENIENSLCVDRNLGRAMTDKDLIAATYISSQTTLVHEAAEKIKDQMVNNGETEESANLHVQNINLLKMNICYPPNIPFSHIKPEKKYYLNDEVIEIDCDDGYKVTGANNQLRCENGLFSPKVYCIAQREIEKQKDSISRHFNKILNLLINSMTGGGGWINAGIEKMNESKDQEGEQIDSSANESEESPKETNAAVDEENNMNISSSSNTTTVTTICTDQNTDNTTKEESSSGSDKNGQDEQHTVESKLETDDHAKKESDNTQESSELLDEPSESDNDGKKILLDRVTGTPILVQNN